MDELVVVRHAIAEARDASRWPDDAQRPLTADGAKRFARAARGLGRVLPEVDAVLASPYVRAWQTAELLEREAGWPAPERRDALGADRPPADVVAALRDADDRRSVAVVGHEPQLTQLVSLLLAGDRGRVPLELRKGGAVVLGCPGGAAPGTAVLRWAVSPKLLRALA